MKESIRLTNKTAMALRRNALRVRRAYFCAAVILSILLGAAGIALGALWLPAAPLMILLIVLIDWLLMLVSRSCYLSMLAQVICTEAAAREIRAGMSNMQRREQAIADLLRAKVDVQQPAKGKKNRNVQEKRMNATPERKAQSVCQAPVQPAVNAEDHEQDAPRRRRQKSLQIIRSDEEE